MSEGKIIKAASFSNFSATVLALSNLRAFWPLNDSSVVSGATCADASGNSRNGVYQSGNSTSSDSPFDDTASLNIPSNAGGIKIPAYGFSGTQAFSVIYGTKIARATGGVVWRQRSEQVGGQFNTALCDASN